MSGLNQLSIIGNIGKKETKNGVTRISVAVNESYKDKSGEKVERTEWFNCSLFKGLSDVAEQYLKVGSKVYIQGKIESRKYTGNDGIERTAVGVVVRDMQMLSSKGDNNASEPQGHVSHEFEDDIPF